MDIQAFQRIADAFMCPIYKKKIELGQTDVPQRDFLTYEERQKLIDQCDLKLCDCYFFACNGGLGAQ